MPIPASARALYGAAWRKVRARILRRAAYKCEQCGVPDRFLVVRGPAGTWQNEAGEWFTCLGAPVKAIDGPTRMIRIILTVAHLNHTPGDDREENLKALCQFCHLHYDKLHHRETRCLRKDAARPMLIS